MKISTYFSLWLGHPAITLAAKKIWPILSWYLQHKTHHNLKELFQNSFGKVLFWPLLLLGQGAITIAILNLLGLSWNLSHTFATLLCWFFCIILTISHCFKQFMTWKRGKIRKTCVYSAITLSICHNFSDFYHYFGQNCHCFAHNMA